MVQVKIVRHDYVAMPYSLFGLSVNWKSWYLGFRVEEFSSFGEKFLRFMFIKWHLCIWLGE